METSSDSESDSDKEACIFIVNRVLILFTSGILVLACTSVSDNKGQ